MKNKSLYFFVMYVLLHTHTLTSAQNVGIGTSSPVEKLHVEGNILSDTAKLNALLITPNAGAGKILTSDDTGNATWEDLILTPPDNSNGNVGYGVWGDCATTGNITEYHPVTDTAGVSGDYFGTSVSISGDFAIVGAPKDDETYSNQGSASMYYFNGNSWEFMQKLTDPDGGFDDNFGNSVCISGNFVIVGADGDDESFVGQGSAIIYYFNGSNWEWIQKLTDADGQSNDRFGFSVAISDNYAIVGAHLDNFNSNTDQGSASIFQYNGSSWELMEKILDSNGALGDEFGFSVSISGSDVIIGAYLDDNSPGVNQGSASIYQFNGTNWEFVQKLTDSSGEALDFFGGSVCISNTYAIIGSSGDKVGTYEGQGSASVFQYNGSNWVLMQKKTNNLGLPNDAFGVCVSVSGNYLLIGTQGDDVSVNGNQGSVSLYQKLGFGWQLLQYITEPGGNASDFFGIHCALDISTRRFLMGASGYVGNSGKAVFGKIN